MHARREARARAIAGVSIGALVLAFIGLRPLPADGLDEARILLDRAAEGLLNETLSSASLRELLEDGLRAFAGLPRACEREYWQARAAYLYGLVEQLHGRPQDAERRFAEGYGLAERALGCGEFSDAYRLMADNRAQLLSLNGALYKMRYGPQVRELAEKALELDAGNVKAKLTLGLYFRNAPSAAGGDEELARRLLHEVEQAGGLEPFDRFSVNLWLGLSYAQSGNTPMARKYVAQAREIFPGNSRLRQIIKEYSL
jgi:tetratricopeptide (TPR) repeat protein